MKTTIICALALGIIGSFASCVHVTKREPVSRTTTTEQTTTSRPFANTTETQTTRTY